MPLRSAEHVALIVCDAAILQQRDEFLLKIPLAMVPFLILNVFPHHGHLRGTYAESTVSPLPAKALSHPARRASFKFLDCAGERILRRQNEEQVQVIGRAPGGDQGKTFAARNPAEIGVEFGDAVGVDLRLTVLRTEYAMNEIACVCVRRACTVPTGLPFYMGSLSPR
jgi:hypothetical protein